MKRVLLAFAALSLAALAAAYWVGYGYGALATSNGPAYFSFKSYQQSTTAIGNGAAGVVNLGSGPPTLVIALARGTGTIAASTVTLDGPGYIYENGAYQMAPVTIVATDNGATGDTFSITAHTGSGDVTLSGTLVSGQIVVQQR